MNERINRNQRIVKTVLSCLLVIGLTTASVHSTPIWYDFENLGNEYDALRGMPDFDQRQNASWYVRMAGQDHPYYCGPTNAANVLWYLDCRHDTHGQTNYNLIEAVHNPSEVHDLIAYLGVITDTPDNENTMPENMTDGLETFFSERSLSNNYDVSIVEKPTLNEIVTWVSSEYAVLLFCKYWYIPTPYHIHWVTVQSVTTNDYDAMVISDPCFDSPDDPWRNMSPGDEIFGTHNTTRIVSHNLYDVGESSLLWSYHSEIMLENIWNKNYHLHVTHAVVIEEVNYDCPNRTISIASCIPYDSDNNGTNDSVTISYGVDADISTQGVVRAKLINPSNATVSTNITGLLSLNPSSSTNGVLNLTLPSNQLSSVYEVHVEVMEGIGSSIDDVDNTTITLTPTNIYAHFWYDNEEGNKSVEFTDASYASSGCTLTNWSWDFDDDSTSTEENPDHTYSYAGTYDVTLTVKDDYGNNDSKTIAITVTGTSPDGEFNLDSTDMQTYLQSMTVRSSVEDSDNPVPLSGPTFNYSWDMGDGTNYYTENVTHNYSKGGKYIVSMTVKDLDNYTDTYKMKYFTPDILVQEGITDNRSINHWGSLSDGLDAASAGDIIYIANGSYNGGLTFSSNLTLVGECRENVTIDTSSIVFTINSDNVSLSNMTLCGGTTGISIDNQSNITLSGLYIRNMTYGISVINNSGNVAVDWSMFENNTYGIYAADSNNLTVGGSVAAINETFNNSVFIENTRAIYLDEMQYVGIMNIEVNATIPYTSLPPPTYGIDMDDSKNVYIDSAHIFNAHTSAINIDESDFVNITGSHLEENHYGIYYTAAEDCLVAGCLINDNDQYATVFSDVLCLDNMVVCNDFINNTAYDSSNKKEGPTVWAYIINSTIGEGNHWNVSGVLFEDNDGDGIADDEMSLDGPLRRDPGDPLPVMKAYDWVS